MQFPIYQVPYLGNGFTIGLNATIHVWISHGLAIGTFVMIALADRMAARGGPHAEEWDAFNHRLLRFTAIVVTAAGAITGAGIWLTTSALATRAIASMLRVFFWPWFTEWVVFVLEVIALLVLYFTWDRLRGERRHWRSKIALVYGFFSFLTAVIITGILGFMLTPGYWPVRRRLSEAFFNPTYAPQLAYRISLALFIGSLVAATAVLFSPGGKDFKKAASRRFAKLTLVFLFFLVVSGVWYFGVVPPSYLQRLRFSVLTSHLSQWPVIFVAINVLGLLVVLAMAWASLRGRPRTARWLVVPALLVSFGVVVEFERVREFIRGPYLMPGYMYANQVLLQEKPVFDRTGMTSVPSWHRAALPMEREHAVGAWLFSRNCSGCHTLYGLNGIARRARGRSEDGLYVIIGRTQEMVSFMTPFSGSPEEQRALARFIYAVSRDEVQMESISRHVPAVSERDE